MNFKLASSGLLSAALLVGCSSAPQLPLPTGQWEDMPLLPPVAPPPSSLPLVVASSAPATPMPTRPVAPVASPKPAALPVAPAPVPVEPAAKPVAAAVKTPATAAPVAAPKPVVKAPEPVTVLPPKSFPSAPPVPVVTVIAPVAPIVQPAVPTPIPKPVWEARAGESLRKVIAAWCQRANYTLDWQADDLDYPIDAPLHFEGSFEDAIAGIFGLYDKADRSFIYDGRRLQHRLNVAENHDKSKRATQ